MTQTANDAAQFRACGRGMNDSLERMKLIWSTWTGYQIGNGADAETGRGRAARRCSACRRSSSPVLPETTRMPQRDGHSDAAVRGEMLSGRRAGHSVHRPQREIHPGMIAGQAELNAGLAAGVAVL